VDGRGLAGTGELDWKSTPVATEGEIISADSAHADAIGPYSELNKWQLIRHFRGGEGIEIVDDGKSLAPEGFNTTITVPGFRQFALKQIRLLASTEAGRQQLSQLVTLAKHESKIMRIEPTFGTIAWTHSDQAGNIVVAIDPWAGDLKMVSTDGKAVNVPLFLTFAHEFGHVQHMLLKLWRPHEGIHADDSLKGSAEELAATSHVNSVLRELGSPLVVGGIQDYDPTGVERGDVGFEIWFAENPLPNVSTNLEN
jgi:hypothetical protein